MCTVSDARPIYLYIVQSVGYKCNLSFKHGVSGASAFYLLNMYLSMHPSNLDVSLEEALEGPVDM